MNNRYNITLSKNDKLIASWKRKAICAKQEEMSTLVRNAILTFIETGTFLDIGHIHFHPEDETVKLYDSIVLQTARTPIVREWIEANVADGLGVSGPIKVLLNECIKVVSDDVAEWFPPSNEGRKDKDLILSKMLKTASKVTGRNIEHESITKVSRSAPVLNDTTTKSKAVSRQEPQMNDDQKQIVSGLNSLLPQRAKKK